MNDRYTPVLDAGARSAGYSLASIAICPPMQMLDATIGGRRFDIEKDELSDFGRTAALFHKLGLTLPKELSAAGGTLSERQKQLNKIAAAIDVNDPNHAIFMTVLAQLIDGAAPNWTAWDAREADTRRMFREEGRRALLDDIHDKFFAGAKPQNALYLGGGEDVLNPLRSTGAKNLTLVDSQPFNIEGVKSKIRAYFNAPDLIFSEEQDGGKVVKLIARRPHADAAVFTVDFREMGYERYFEGAQTKFDVLFDKDSWLRDAGPPIVTAFADRLKTAGIWVSNYTLGGDMLQSLFDDAGIVDRTDLLDPLLKHVSFGFDKAKIYQKAENFRAAFFAIVSDYASAKPLRNSLEIIANNKPVDFDTMKDLKESVRACCAAAVEQGKKIEGFESMAAKLLRKTEQIIECLDGLTLPEDADF